MDAKSTSPVDGSAKPKLLILDSDQNYVHKVCGFLESIGFDIIAATSVDSAARLVSSVEGIALMMIDIVNPQLRGLDVIRRLHAARSTRQIPIVATGASATRELAASAINAGAITLLNKSASKPEYLEKVIWSVSYSRRPVLIIDDEQAIRKVLKVVMERANVPVVMAESVAEARNVVATTDIKCVLCDICLPDSSGLDFLVEVKDSHPYIPFVMMSGRGAQSREEVIAIGADDYLAKPFKSEDVLAKIDVAASAELQKILLSEYDTCVKV